MESKQLGEEEILKYVDRLDFSIGCIVGVRVDYPLHVPRIDKSVLDASIAKLGTSEFDFAPGEHVISNQVFDQFGCGYMDEEGERCNLDWAAHSPEFTVQIEMRKDVYSNEFVIFLQEFELLEFISELHYVEFVGDFKVKKLKEGGDAE